MSENQETQLQFYTQLSEEEVLARLWQAKRTLGKTALILGHHYQSDAVIQYADYRGDSLELSRRAAMVKEAKYIVFCGVRFMAESAAILGGEHQVVLHPAPEAGCPLADFAQLEDVERAWDVLQAAGVERLIPITYVNSSADVKAFCGQRGGLTCTSSNVAKVLSWALGHNRTVLFLPDENLGRNTARALGLAPTEVATWDFMLDQGGHDKADLPHYRLFAWKGHCHVHTRFSLTDIARVRQESPRAQIVVHPECLPPVVEASDASGSTSFIVRAVHQAPAGACLGIGTEINLVGRLAKEYPDKTVLPLSRSLCPNMFRVNVYRLLHTLESIMAGEPVNTVRVPDETVAFARQALERMLAFSAKD